MPSIQARGLSFAYRDAAPLFRSIDLHLGPGWHGLVGANGAGKTTLLALLAGAIAPDEGDVLVRPGGASVRLCPQRLERAGASEARLAVDEGPRARELVGRLALDRAALARWPTLSPGERKRWQIAAALADDPDVLLLDEPTNHLDGDARALLVAALARFRGVGVVVSHDRALLDELTSVTMRLHRARVDVTPLPYGAARAAWEAGAAAAVRERARAVGEVRALRLRLGDARRERESAERGLSSGHRMKSRDDHDARSAGAKFRAEHAEARRGRDVGVLRASLERAAGAVPTVEVDAALGRSVFVDYERAPRRCLFALDAPVLRAGAAPILRDVRVAVGRDERVRVVGPNGAGKSTLLAALLASSTLPEGRVLALPQELSEREGAAAVGAIRALPPSARGRVLSLVAALGVEPARLLASASPSPGEARKARIALGLGLHAWALVLDEPTNHLDLPSIERLEAALAAYPGALVLVSHDDTFAARACRATWRVEGGRVDAG